MNELTQRSTRKLPSHSVDCSAVSPRKAPSATVLLTANVRADLASIGSIVCRSSANTCAWSVAIDSSEHLGHRLPAKLIPHAE